MVSIFALVLVMPTLVAPRDAGAQQLSDDQITQIVRQMDVLSPVDFAAYIVDNDKRGEPPIKNITSDRLARDFYGEYKSGALPFLSWMNRYCERNAGAYDQKSRTCFKNSTVLFYGAEALITLRSGDKSLLSVVDVMQPLARNNQNSTQLWKLWRQRLENIANRFATATGQAPRPIPETPPPTPEQAQASKEQSDRARSKYESEKTSETERNAGEKALVQKCYDKADLSIIKPPYNTVGNAEAVGQATLLCIMNSIDCTKAQAVALWHKYYSEIQR